MANDTPRKKSTRTASNGSSKPRVTPARAAAERALLFPPPAGTGRAGKPAATEPDPKTTATGPGGKTTATGRGGKTAHAPSQTGKALTAEPADSLLKRLTGLPGAMAGGAVRLAIRTTEIPLKVGKAFLKPEQTEMMEEAGRMLKDLREVAGLTRDELSDALNLKDRSLLEAIENGTAIMSFELIMRLAAVLARHDPLPVVLKFTRTYNPELWKIFENWGFGRLSLNFEREREFINIYRRHDAARQLSDAEFAKILDFTRAAFDMALQFAAEQKPGKTAGRPSQNTERKRGDET
jgi:transcriptional regulator with XRE-family HTH domain